MMAADGPTFELWLEFEQWQAAPDDDPEDDFCNTLILLPDGRRYALCIWTHAYFARVCAELRESGEALGGRYVLPPDLFVERLDRDLMEEVVADLIRKGALKEPWRSASPPESESVGE